MGLGCQVVTGHVLAPGATLTALTMASGDTLTIANFNLSTQAYLDQAFVHEATKGILRIRTPRMHDASQNMRLAVGDTTPRLLLSDAPSQPLYPGDTLTVELSGGGAGETDSAALLLYYNDMPGVSARLAHYEEIASRVVNIFGLGVLPVTSATAGEWGTGRALNADFDTFKSDSDYALLGYLVDTACAVVAVSGTDTGNLKIGGPGNVDHYQTHDFFVQMAKRTGRPYIPIIAGNNKASTLVFVADPAVGATITTTLMFAELRTA